MFNKYTKVASVKSFITFNFSITSYYILMYFLVFLIFIIITYFNFSETLN